MTDKPRSTKDVLEGMTQKDWEIIGLKATVAQQAKMIEHLRGGLGNEPQLISYAEDMSTCALTNGDGNGYFYNRIDPDQPAIYTALDMTTAAAQGFRDGAASAEPLKAFANEMVSAAFEGGGFDGGDIQDIAVKHGLLRIENRTEECCEGCQCREYGFPAECYRKAEILTDGEVKP